jgi:putative endonuclease
MIAVIAFSASLPGLTRQSILLNDEALQRGSRWRVGMAYWVYILASAPGGTLYVGVTNDLVRRTYEHREGLVEGFTRKYDVKRLVYFEAHDSIIAAIQREKNIKHWSREWKIDLIVRGNPSWDDLYDEIVR